MATGQITTTIIKVSKKSKKKCANNIGTNKEITKYSKTSYKKRRS